MKFVHLTPRANIALIKKNGIRKGKRWYPKGIYAMPLIMLPRETIRLDPHSDDWDFIPSVPVSTSRFWTFLFEGENSRRWSTKAAAIVFTMPESAWPIHLYLRLRADRGGLDLLKWIKKSPDRHQMISEEDLQSGLDDLSENDASLWDASVELTVCSEKMLGAILRQYLASGGVIRSADMKLVIDVPIPPPHIERIIPFYRTNRKYKTEKERDKFKEEDRVI